MLCEEKLSISQLTYLPYPTRSTHINFVMSSYLIKFITQASQQDQFPPPYLKASYQGAAALLKLGGLPPTPLKSIDWLTQNIPLIHSLFLAFRQGRLEFEFYTDVSLRQNFSMINLVAILIIKFINHFTGFK